MNIAVKTYKGRWVAALSAVMLISLGTSPSWAAGIIKDRANPNNELEMLDHKVDVILNNGFAEVEIKQSFRNHGEQPMEAIYSFPVPKQASVSEVSLLIGERELLGEVVERETARKTYEEERSKGNNTALAEKNDYKTFDIAIGNVRPGEDANIRIVYYQPLEIDLGVGRFVYPLAEGNTDDARIPFWSVDDQLNGSLEFNLTLKSAFPIKDVRMPGWEQQAEIVRNASADEQSEIITARLVQSEAASLSKDLVFYYRLDDTLPGGVEVIPYRESAKDPGTFMMVVTPAADLQPLQQGSDWVFVLDVSGSMSGNKISTLADGVSQVLGDMRPEDRFRIVTFNNSARDLTGKYIDATPSNVQKWISKVKPLQPNGGTALYAGLEKGLRVLDEDRTTGFVLVTDGVGNIGETAHKHFIHLLKQHDVRLFTFIIGNSANQPLMERIALESNGFAMNISDADDIVGRLIQAKSKVLHEAMHDVEVVIKGERVYDMTPKRIGSLYRGEQLVVFGRYHGAGPVDVELKAKISGQEKSWNLQTVFPEVDQDNPELERLWALSSIEETMQVIRDEGESPTLKKEVMNLGVDYSLVTDYTSMLVLEDDAFENHGIDRKNASRVAKERAAKAQRQQQPVKNYNVDNGSTFKGLRAPSIGGGSGPVGPLFLLLLALVKKLSNKK